MSQALIGLAGGVLGVLATLALSAWHEVRKIRAAARLLLLDFDGFRASLSFALDENDWAAISHPQDLDVQAWRATATDLGAGLGPRAWDTVASAARDVEQFQRMVERGTQTGRVYPSTDPEAPPSADWDHLIELERNVGNAILALSKVSRWEAPEAMVRLEREHPREPHLWDEAAGRWRPADDVGGRPSAGQ